MRLMRIKTSYIGLKIEPELRKACKAKAGYHRLGLSEWLRRIILMHVDVPARQNGKRKSA